MARPVSIVTSGAHPYVAVVDGPPATPVTTGNAPPIVLVESGAPPICLVDDNGDLTGQSLYTQLLSQLSASAALYDPSDLTSLYQSRTGGSTGAVDSVVGIMLDKRQMGTKTAAAFVAGQTELVANGGFSSSDNWTNASTGTGSLSISGGAATIVGTDGSNRGAASQATGLTVGTWYVLTFNATITSGAGTSFGQAVGNGGAAIVSGANVVVFRALATDLIFYTNSSAGNITIDNVSVRAIPGYHALAPSDAARPILRSSGGLYYLDADGTDDWYNVTPTLDLGEEWAHVGGWQTDADTDSPFATSSQETTIIRISSDWRYYTGAGAVGTLGLTGNIAAPHALTVEQASLSAISARLNGVSGSAAERNPYDGSSPTRGLALFSRENDTYSFGLDGRFYGGLWTPGSLTSDVRALAERWVASKTGVTL